VLENRKKYPEAEKVYEKGIQMIAQPIDRLKKRYGHFKARMAQRFQLAAELETPEEKAFEETDSHRVPFQKLTKKQASSSIRSGKATTSGLALSNHDGATNLKRKPNHSNLDIFVDSSPNLQESVSTWNNLESLSEMSKENKVDSTTWNLPLNTAKKSKTSAVNETSNGRSFTVFVEDLPNCSAKETKTSQSISLRERIDGKLTHGNLKQNP